MAIHITSLDEAIDDNGLKVLVHGLSGAGKTVMCATSGTPTLILNAEGGLLSLKDAPAHIKKKLSVAKVKSIADFEEIIQMLKNDYNSGNQRFDWIALDSISDVSEAVLKTEMDACADPRKSYPAFQAAIDSLIKDFRDLAGYNIIMTAKQKLTKDDYTGITLRSPMMPGNKLGPAIPYLFDLVLALRVEKDEDGVDYRTVQTGRDIMYEAKDRSGALSMFEQPSLKKIAAKIHSKLDSDSDKVDNRPVAPTGDMNVDDSDRGGGVDDSDQSVVNASQDKMIYWYHEESDSVGDCMQSDFEDLCDEAPGGLVEISVEEYEKHKEDNPE